MKTKWIEILVGGRRVGKTSIMKSLINGLLDKGVSSRSIMYYTPEALPEDITIRQLYDHYLESAKYNRKLKYLFIDEAQDISNWQKDVKFIYDNTKVKVFLSGSSSLVLKPETSKLTGRFSLTEVSTLSYKEFLYFKGLKHSADNLEDYLRVGGYPEIVLTGDVDKLYSTVESTLYRDLLSYYGIRNPIFLKDLLDYLAEKTANPVSLNRIRKDLKVAEETAQFYLQYLQDVYIVHKLTKYGSSHKVTKSSVPKYYLSDTGTLYWRSKKKKKGQLAETAVYLELRRRSERIEYPDIAYTETADGKEIDFRVHEYLYEVKVRNEITEDDIGEYSDGSNINLIVGDTSKIDDAIAAYPEINAVKLSEFLLFDA